MAALAKLTILVGAGVAGTLLAKEGNLFDIADFFSGAFKIFRKHLQQDKTGSSSVIKPQNELLLAQFGIAHLSFLKWELPPIYQTIYVIQDALPWLVMGYFVVNNLRKQLQSLQSSGPVTIVTGSSSGSGTFSVTAIVVVGAFGYGYIWWKGWKLSDMMFVTRRGLSDARNSVAKQLETISSSISSTKRHLSSRIDRVDCSLNDCIDLSAATRDEASTMHGELSGIHTQVENVHVKVRTLETKLGRIGGSQDLTTRGIRHLCEFAMSLERGRNRERIQVAQSPSRLALEPPPVMPVTTTGSLPPVIKVPESSSPSPTIETPKVLRTVTVSASGLKELQEVSNSSRGGHFRSNVMRTASNSDAERGTPVAQEPNGGTTSSSGRFGWKFPGLLSRTRSAS